MISRSVKAGALQYTIFISVIVALLVTSFIGLSYLHQKTRMKSLFMIDAIDNANNGFNHLITNEIGYNSPVTLKFTDSIENSTTLIKREWGIYDIVAVNAKVKNEAFNKIGLIGGSIGIRPSIYLKDNSKPLILVGKTVIKGEAYLPEKGARKGSIGGNSYRGAKLIYGNTHLSRSILPLLTNREKVSTPINASYLRENFERFELQENTKYISSFSDKTLFFESRDFIDLEFIELTGNIVIQSHTGIAVSPSSKLEDIILVAPIIEVRNGVKGNFQALASEQIFVDSNCQLNYPSALVLNEKVTIATDSTLINQQPVVNQIQIASNTIVKGIITFLSKEIKNNYKPQIIISANAEVWGEVYCDRNTDLRGTVIGSVYTDHFIAMQSGSVYINHIFNGEIITPDLTPQYSGLQFLKTQRAVAKWLY